MTGKARNTDLDKMFNEASAHLDAGRHREAFRLFHEAALAGDRASWLNVGYCFHLGQGVRRSRQRALFWYLYLGPLDDRAKARSALTRVARARDITENTREQAEALLSQMQPLRKTRAGL